jgi:deoxycytidine triphosphate deaminase
MSILVDGQIRQRLGAASPLATNVSVEDFRKAWSKIQAASLDLTIGDIYIPGTEDDKPGGAYAPLREHALAQGHTAVIKTKEALDLGSDLAGIAFPPASISLKGLLTTNPGHIDPGYRGPLHLTVINMSRVPFSLKSGDRIIRVLFVPLSAQPEADYGARHRSGMLPSPITPELLGRLSVDFLDVEKRASRIADGAVTKAQYRAALIATGIPVLVAFITLLGTIWTANLSTKSDIQKLNNRVTVIETKLGEEALDERIRKLEDVVAKLVLANPSK